MTNAFEGEPPPTASPADSPAPVVPKDEFPDRYNLRERDGVKALVGREAPGVAVRLDRHFAFSEAEARKLGERTILIDGAGAFGPLIDDNTHLYNLDHHQGCLRAFTLATCEQALLLVNKGLELDKGEWTIYANEPDLDTLFALWALLNYRRVRQLSSEARDRIVPLFRLEGAIDANGFDLAEYCGLTTAELAQRRGELDKLHTLELEARRQGDWNVELGEYCRRLLKEIDRIAFRPEDLDDDSTIEEEYNHVDIGQGRVAVICRDPAGIYEVERRLKRIWGDRLGIIALEKEPGQFTLRRSAALAGIDLKVAYERLNLLDPAVDGRPPSKKWGGSDEIGGSPRGTGTGLTPREIAKILKLTYKKSSPSEGLRQILTAAGLSLVVSGLAAGALLLKRFLGVGLENPSYDHSLPVLLVALILVAASYWLTRYESRGWTWLYGWRRPAGWSWLPAALGVAGLAGWTSAWLPQTSSPSPGPFAFGLLALALFAIGTEMLFRGLAHGLQVLEAEIPRVDGPLFLSRPNLVSAFLYSLIAASALWLLEGPNILGLNGMATAALTWVVFLVAGILAGVLREKSLSIWPAAIAWALGAQARLCYDLIF